MSYTGERIARVKIRAVVHGRFDLRTRPVLRAAGDLAFAIDQLDCDIGLVISNHPDPAVDVASFGNTTSSCSPGTCRC
jgi:hypothetical protein